MLQAPAPADEAERLETLRLRGLMYSPMEERFDALTRAAQRDLDVPIALISLVGEDVQWFKSAKGLHTAETPRAFSFCAHALEQRELFVVEDARADERFSDNPLVTGAPHIRFYAGAPLRLSNGSALGVLCDIDHVARTLTEHQRTLLRTLGQAAAAEMAKSIRNSLEFRYLDELGTQANRARALDPLTRTWGADALRTLFERASSDSSEPAPIALFSIGIVHCETLAEWFGASRLDEIVFNVSACIREWLSEVDFLGYVGDGEFIVILREPRAMTMEALAGIFRDEATAVAAEDAPPSTRIQVHAGYVKMVDMPRATYPEIWKEAAIARENAHFLDGVCKGPILV